MTKLNIPCSLDDYVSVLLIYGIYFCFVGNFLPFYTLIYTIAPIKDLLTNHGAIVP